MMPILDQAVTLTVGELLGGFGAFMLGTFIGAMIRGAFDGFREGWRDSARHRS